MVQSTDLSMNEIEAVSVHDIPPPGETGDEEMFEGDDTELGNVMCDLGSLFSEETRDDIEKIGHIRSLLSEYCSYLGEKSNQVDAVVNEVRDRISSKSDELMRLEHTLRDETSERDMEERKQAVHSSIEAVREEKEQIQARLEKLAIEHEQLAIQSKQREADIEAERKKRETYYQLYEKIFRTQFHAVENPNLCKGCIAHKEEAVGRMEPFEFDLRKISSFELTQQLWEKVERVVMAK